MSEIVAIVSAGIALLALFVSLLNRRTANRALTMSERQEARREVPFGLYLNEALRWEQDREALLVHGAHIRVSNPADRPVAVDSADLRIQYTGPGGVVVTVRMPCVSDEVGPSTGLPVDPIGLPLIVDANSAKAGWLLFRIDKSLTGSAPVDRYDVVLDDIYGRSESVHVVEFHEAEP